MSFFNRISTGGLTLAAGLAVSAAAFAASPAPAPAAPAPAPPAGSDRIANPVAEFAGIDKITGRIITFDVYIDETVQFGALQVTPRVCYSRPQNEEPKTDSFVEVDEITLDRKIRRIFTGWMFAESPGLNAVEHAVYDVWLKECKQKSDVPAPDATKADATKADASKPAATKPAAAKPAASPDAEQSDPTQPDTSDAN
ncbi:glycosyl hydrolase family 5 [Mesorhizobium sp. WSM4312]|uniref:DUF2155 domain-containing protein n=1 Tax=unclassified Mesorhizobium TaxID=325217 RepID=UPI000BAFBA4D|nr:MULTISPECIES: DUF2155 domain-containing protein [unclassified Mesorhizobium]PBB28017.1 glycosyl hydrolase family 5 [Mesorhizobium sp. WSM4304]PBB68199.1 glycosyl hydrolase family 5 [Mesorhizobium sp. WSM4312]PBB75452.1 glycosyl hydrolase family 5 [Mesorhizobium sp. WSM4308]PBC23050.1 glycosyl hydrolase family 5 [Mesorhizobium sp. WSM4311]TRC74328.1 DUF2155 domain-containing protein [Mesorhizobium sp. WSM4310]